MKTLVIYDLDGTLVDTLADLAAAANHMLRQLGRPELPAGKIRGFVGHGLHQLIRGCLETDDARLIERATKFYKAYYGAHLADHSRLYPHVREVLEHFRTRHQAVVTNKPNPFTQDLLRALGIADCFFEIVAGDEAYPKKPDPAALLALMAKTGAAPAQTLLIGDSLIDIEAGQRAGIMTVAVAQGLEDREGLVAARPDMLVADFQELLAVAGREGW